MDVHALADKAASGSQEIAVPDQYPGRELQLDGDVVSYQCADLDVPIEKNVEQMSVYVLQQGIMSGAAHIVCHLTVSGSKKSGRYEIAQVLEYQATRTKPDLERLARVHQLRDVLGTDSFKQLMDKAGADHKITYEPLNAGVKEADDTMSARQMKAVQSDYYSSVIMTVDKDLMMVPGLHMHPQTYEMKTVNTNGRGELEIDDSKSSKKLVGTGIDFFFAQMIMGDKADNIPGLPYAATSIINEYDPTKAMEKLSVADRLVKGAKRKPKTVGPVLAGKILMGCRSLTDMARTVVKCYRAHYGDKCKYINHRNEEVEHTVYELLAEQAALLWMHRTDTATGESVYEAWKEIFTGVSSMNAPKFTIEELIWAKQSQGVI